MVSNALSGKGQLLQMELKGARELAAELREIAKENSRPDRLIKSTIRRALKKSAAPVAAAAQQLAPRSDAEGPHMADKIKVSTTLSRKQRAQQGFGSRGSLRDKSSIVMYIGAGPKGPAVLAEFGTGPRYTKDGAFRGSMPAQPFMRPAWEGGKQGVLNSFVPQLAKEIVRTAERARKRQMKRAGIL